MEARLWQDIVTSSSSYSNSSEVKAKMSEVQRFPGIGFSSCTVPTFSCVQGISNGGYKSSFWNVLEQRMCTRMVLSTSGKTRGAEVKSSEVYGMCEMHQNRNRAYWKSSQVEQDNTS